MPGVYTLTYRDGRVEELWGHRGYYYVMSPDDLLSFLPGPAWCHICDDFALAERLRKPAEIEAEIKDNEDPQSRQHQRYFAGKSSEYLQRHQSRLRRELVHSTGRKSPPKCMQCGKSQVSFFDHGKWAPHPKTSEEVFFKIVGMGSTDFAMRFFNPEGEELEISEDQRSHYYSIINAGDL